MINTTAVIVRRSSQIAGRTTAVSVDRPPDGSGGRRLTRVDALAGACTVRPRCVLGPIRAEVAFLRSVRVRIDVALIVRARDHAGPASNAAVAVEIDDAVAALVERVGRADLRAGRFVALVTEDRE